MSNNKEYLSASIFYLIGNIIGQGIVLLSSGIFTRIMDQNAYGMVNTYSAWVLVLNTFIGLNLFITVRNAYIDYHDKYEDFKSSVLLFSIIAFAIITCLIIGVICIFNIQTDIFVICIAAFQAISVHTVNYEMAALSMQGRYKLRTLLLILPNATHTLLSIALIYIYTKNQYYAKISGNAIGIFVYAVLIIVVVFYKNRPQINKEYWKYAACIAVPAIGCTLSDLILLESDRIMITNIIGADETAVYSLVYNIGSILIALYTAINGSWTPWFYKNLHIGKVKEIKKVQGYYVAIFLFMAVGLLTISPEIIKILSPKEYWFGIDYVSLIVIASFLMFLYAFFTTYLMYLKKTVIIAVNTAIAAVLNLILNYFLIGTYKGVGAAIATIISYIILFILHWFASKKQDDDVFNMKIIFASLLVLVLYSFIFYFIRNNFIIRYAIVLIMIVVALIVLLKYKKGKIKL